MALETGRGVEDCSLSLVVPMELRLEGNLADVDTGLSVERALAAKELIGFAEIEVPGMRLRVVPTVEDSVDGFDVGSGVKRLVVFPSSGMSKTSPTSLLSRTSSLFFLPANGLPEVPLDTFSAIVVVAGEDTVVVSLSAVTLKMATSEILEMFRGSMPAVLFDGSKGRKASIESSDIVESSIVPFPSAIEITGNALSVSLPSMDIEPRTARPLTEIVSLASPLDLAARIGGGG